MTEACVYDAYSQEFADLFAFFLPILLLFLCRCHHKTPPRVATRHVTVNAAVLDVGKRQVRAHVDASTTAMDVVLAVLEECAVSNMPGSYSLWIHTNGKGDRHSSV